MSYMTSDVIIPRTRTIISKEVSGSCLEKVKISMGIKLILVSFDKITKKIKVYTHGTTFEKIHREIIIPIISEIVLRFHLHVSECRCVILKIMNSDFC